MIASTSSPANAVSSNATVTHDAIKIDGLTIEYLEAGDPTSPKVLLLHGFPASSHEYRKLIVTLAARFHVIAPDYHGYSFDGIVDMIDELLVAKGFDRFGLTLRTAARLAFES